MMAHSLVGCVAALAEDVDEVLECPRITDPLTVTRGLAALKILRDLGSQVQVAVPLPVLDSKSDPVVDDAVEAVVAATDSNGPPLAADIDTAVDNNRLVFANGRILVPLDDGAGRHNWGPVFRFLAGRLETLLEDIERILGRLRQASDAGSVTRRLWGTVREMVRDTRVIVRIGISRQARYSHIASRPSDGPERFGRWAIDHIRSHQ